MITLPMHAYYRRGQEFEARRAEFYAHLHGIIGLEGWKTRPIAVSDEPQLGFDGMPPQIKPQGRDSAVTLNVNAAPLEWLVAIQKLQLGIDKPGAQTARYDAARKFRTAVEGAQLTTMRSPDLEAVGGGGKGMSVSDHKLDCMKRCGRFQKVLGIDLYRFVERAIVLDDFSAIRKADKSLDLTGLKQLHMALDLLAEDMGLITTRAFKDRWSRMPRASAGHPRQDGQHSGQSAEAPDRIRASRA